MPIQVDITTALDKAHIKGVAYGAELFGSDQAKTWYDWFNIPTPEDLWDQLQDWWGVQNGHAPLADHRFTTEGITAKVYVTSQGFIELGTPARDSGVIAEPASPEADITFAKTAALLDHHVFHNGLPSKDKAEYSASLSLEVKQGVSSEWSKETSIGGSVTVGVKVGVEGAGDVETSTSFNWDTKVGESHTQSKELGAGDTTELKVELAPGDWALGMFGAYLGSIKANVKVNAQLRGGIVFLMNSHHWLNMPASNGTTIQAHAVYVPWSDVELMLRGYHGSPIAQAADLTIDVGWYADTRVEAVPLKDGSDTSIKQALQDALQAPSLGDGMHPYHGGLPSTHPQPHGEPQ